MFGRKKAKPDWRFKLVGTEDYVVHSFSVIMDSETGVQYLFATIGGYAGGLTVLVDKDGKPLIDKNYQKITNEEVK
ncbi:MAG: DUF6440 family protein [Oscillospiraceae bacterium]|jgi:hypothetical protein|nr:DUF6440 family protein [Oscillospiraceae bacterium]